MESTRIKIVVAAHKPYRMPAGEAYLPLQVGAAGREAIDGMDRDDTGENISAHNANWCELTGLYWAWRNLPPTVEAVGLVHYRRHFRGAAGVATGEEIAERLASCDVVLPRPRNYFIETTYSQYVHAHHAADLDVTRAILAERHPDCLAAFDAVMKSTKGHRFNMLVMKRTIFNAYCAWLFDVLFELERRLDISEYSAYDARVFGFVAERLLDVWLASEGVRLGVRTAELPVVNLESQHWPAKIGRFLLRKVRGFSGLSTVDAFKHLKAADAITISNDELRRLQLALVGIVDDIAAVCDEHGLTYALGGGSALGARRHQGFIPWDDDVDLNLPRADYDRFIPLFRARFGHKYWIHTPAETANYGLALGRIRLRGTSVRTREDLANAQAECGVFVDLFIVENTFDNSLLRGLHHFGSLALGLLYSCRKFFFERRFVRQWAGENAAFSLAFRLKLGIGFFTAVLPLDFWTRLWDRWNRLCRNDRSRYVTIPVGRRHFGGELARREDLCETREVEWEGRMRRCPKDLDGYMRRLYGADYLTPPPPARREQHVFFRPFILPPLEGTSADA